MEQFEKPTVRLNASNGVMGISNFQIGQLLASRYRILRELGRGGMGIVLEVENVLVAKPFALKLLDLQEDSSSALPRFQREAKLLMQLEHPNIVRALDFGLLDESVPYVLMELIHGLTLNQKLRQSGPMSEKELIGCFVPILEALHYAHHKGIVHRDIKPGNIMLSQGENDSLVPKILDFGIAAFTEAAGEALTRTGEIIGTPLYMSPEQVSGATIKPTSDIYSLGCVMFEALTGAPPFNGRTALETMMLHKSEAAPTLKEASLGGEFSESIEGVIARMLAKNSEERYQTCKQVIEALTGSVSVPEVVNLPQQKTVQGLTVESIVRGSAFLFVVLLILGLLLWVLIDSHNGATQVARVATAGSSSESSGAETRKGLTIDSLDMPEVMSSKRGGLELIEEDGNELKTKSDGFRHFDIKAGNFGDLFWIDLDGKSHQHTLKSSFKISDKFALWFKPSVSALSNPTAISRITSKVKGVIIRVESADGFLSSDALPLAIRCMPSGSSICIESTFISDPAIASLEVVAPEWLSLRAAESKISAKSANLIAERLNYKALHYLNLNLELNSFHKPFLKKLGQQAALGNSQLFRLGLSRCQLDQDDFKHIAKLNELRFLNVIDSIDFRRGHIEVLTQCLKGCPHLESLAMGGEALTMNAAKVLVEMKSLKSLYFRNSQRLKPEVRKLLLDKHLKVTAVDSPALGFEPWLEDLKI